MNFSEYLFRALELLGTVAFSLSGAMVAVEAGMDLFGVLVLGVVTATGGGMLRDILLGRLPPRVFSNQIYVWLAAGTALALFLLARRFQERYKAQTRVVDTVNNLFDAVGLGAFVITGVQAGLLAGHGDNFFLLLVVGVLTGVGGGVMRDMMVGHVPVILRKHIYALAALTGAAVYLLLLRTGLPAVLISAFSLLSTVALRVLATVFRWNLPRALD